jgi:hypothetical protein
MIGPRQRSIPDNTQHSQVTDMHAPGGNRTCNPKKRVTADPRSSTVYFNKITQEEMAHLLVRSDKKENDRWEPADVTRNTERPLVSYYCSESA